MIEMLLLVLAGTGTFIAFRLGQSRANELGIVDVLRHLPQRSPHLAAMSLTELEAARRRAEGEDYDEMDRTGEINEHPREGAVLLEGWLRGYDLERHRRHATTLADVPDADLNARIHQALRAGDRRTCDELSSERSRRDHLNAWVAGKGGYR